MLSWHVVDAPSPHPTLDSWKSKQSRSAEEGAKGWEMTYLRSVAEPALEPGSSTLNGCALSAKCSASRACTVSDLATTSHEAEDTELFTGKESTWIQLTALFSVCTGSRVSKIQLGYFFYNESHWATTRNSGPLYVRGIWEQEVVNFSFFLYKTNSWVQMLG